MAQCMSPGTEAVAYSNLPQIPRQDVDSKVSAIHEALGIYFDGMDMTQQGSILRWHGPLRYAHVLALPR